MKKPNLLILVSEPRTITIKVNYAWICDEILARNQKFMENTTLNDAIEILQEMAKEQE
jgi:hypothetical protein